MASGLSFCSSCWNIFFLKALLHDKFLSPRLTPRLPSTPFRSFLKMAGLGFFFFLLRLLLFRRLSPSSLSAQNADGFLTSWNFLYSGMWSATEANMGSDTVSSSSKIWNEEQKQRQSYPLQSETWAREKEVFQLFSCSSIDRSRETARQCDQIVMNRKRQRGLKKGQM